MRIYHSQTSCRSADRLAPNPVRRAGFSLVEVLIAMTILAVGLTAMAALVTQTLSGTDRARYLSVATTLVSEKLEDLNRWPNVDPHVAAGGGLTADTASGSINYYDDIEARFDLSAETMASLRDYGILYDREGDAEYF